MTLSMSNPTARIDWVRTLRVTKIGGAIVMAFAAGGWFARIDDHAAQLPYMKRVTIQHETEERAIGANPVATVNCLKRKTDVAVKIANQAIEVAQDANSDEVVPSLAGLPNCPKVKAMPMTASKVR